MKSQGPHGPPHFVSSALVYSKGTCKRYISKSILNQKVYSIFEVSSLVRHFLRLDSLDFYPYGSFFLGSSILSIGGP